MVRIGDILVFVEVKVRRTLAAAAEALLPAQLRRLERAAEQFCLRTAVDWRQTLRFDAVLVGEGGRTEVIENATLA